MTQAASTAAPDAEIEAHLKQLLKSQRATFLSEAGVPAELRIDRLERAVTLLVDHEHDIAAALAADFGQRPAVLTRFTDIMSSVRALQHLLVRRPPYGARIDRILRLLIRR